MATLFSKISDAEIDEALAAMPDDGHKPNRYQMRAKLEREAATTAIKRAAALLRNDPSHDNLVTAVQTMFDLAEEAMEKD